MPLSDEARAAARDATLHARPTSLDDLKGDSQDFSDDEIAWLNALTLDTWDSPDYYVYPVLVLFARASANDDWVKHCKSDKMYAGATSDGWMDEASKLGWYKKARTAPGCPFADVSRRTIDQRDQHYSNDSIAQSQLQEHDNNVGLGTPGHHTAALQHMDQRGGPIQHANRILRPLMRREQRAKGEITIPRMMRLIEIAVAASHTPKIFSRSSPTRRVGWHEDETGKLCYDPMATCDKSVLTTPVAPSLGAAAQVGSIGFSPAAAGSSGLVPTAAVTAAAAAAAAAAAHTSPEM
eukprot:3870141-Prymnesium_polylepis.1